MTTKPALSFWGIWNMSFGFLGIQFGWALQMANMTPIYEYLGAKPDEIPILWLAAPLTGLLVQPIIGYLSDRTWSTRFGRRKPYFLMGAILASLALVFMPNSSAIWMAAGLLWILDASINISMEPFRAFVADMLPEKQHTKGFTMQSMFIGLGAVVASMMPFLLTQVFGMSSQAEAGAIPKTVELSFYIGAVVFISAVLVTVFTTKEYPPTDISEYRKAKEVKRGLGAGAKEIFHSITHMPSTMRQLALVQFFTWPGLFLMWFYFGSSVAYDVLGARDTTDPLYAEGTEWGGVCFAFYSAVTFLFAFVIPYIERAIGKKWTHTICLCVGAAGLFSVGAIHDKYWLFLSMTGVGIAWSSILSMPYAMLAPSLPANKVGIYMGIFNFFIVIPEIIATLGFGWIMEHVLDNNRVQAVMTGGALLLVAALLTLRVREKSSADEDPILAHTPFSA